MIARQVHWENSGSREGGKGLLLQEIEEIENQVQERGTKFSTHNLNNFSCWHNQLCVFDSTDILYTLKKENTW